MRIAFVSTLKGSPWGGSEELWTAACLAANRAGHQTLVSRYQWDTTPPKLDMLRAAGAELSYRPRRPNKLVRLLPRPSWLKKIEAFKPDVVCLSQGGAYECAGHRSARPLIKWLARSQCELVNVIQFNARDTSLGAAAARYARWLYERASINAFVAQENIDMAADRLGMPIPRSRVVNNPVNIKDRTALPWPSDRGGEGLAVGGGKSSENTSVACLACVARLDARTKGQDMLLDVLASPTWRERRWSLSLYGEGPDRERYQQTVNDAGLQDHVHFRGFTDDVRGIWRDHHALVLPSRAEGTPLAMLEAMLLGRPVLVTNVGGCAGWVDDGVEGFIAPAATREHVAAAMERFWKARGRWQSMGVAARERADRQLGPDPGADLMDLLLSTRRTEPAITTTPAQHPAPAHATT